MSAARSKISLTTLALCISLSAHAALLGAVVTYYVRSIGRIYLPGFDRIAVRDGAKVLVSLPVDDQLGKINARGEAIDESPGDDPLQARQADQNQAFLSRDAQSDGAAGAQRASAQASAQLPAQEEPPAVPFGVGQISDAQQPVQEMNRAASSAGQSAGHSAGQSAGQSGAQTSPQPAPQAETESDPVTTASSLEFHAGKLTIQSGRPHRIILPRVGLAGIVDAAELDHIEIILELTLDQTGNVKQARIVKSSGSDNLDQVWRVAAYSWWFEPRKNKNGKPVDQTFKFPIRYL